MPWAFGSSLVFANRIKFAHGSGALSVESECNRICHRVGDWRTPNFGADTGDWDHRISVPNQRVRLRFAFVNSWCASREAQNAASDILDGSQIDTRIAPGGC